MSPICLYKKKPLVISAVQWTGFNYTEVEQFMGEKTGEGIYAGPGGPYEVPIKVIVTLEGAMNCSPGDWIIKGVKGEFYPCKPDIFEATYEKVD
jgi:hypothetical protein